MSSTASHLDSPWPHRFAVALVLVTFPLIWVGGLVTSYDAGMAVPDWPNTYGYNLFLYPLKTWITGPWSLFIEHGHRLLGSLAGMMAIGLVVAAWATHARPLVRWLSVVALAGVIGQGVLGGLRVIQDQVELARVHGCVGPAFFAFAVAVATITSPRWQRSPSQQQASPEQGVAWNRIERAAIVTTILAYSQIVIGSFLRHLPSGSTPSGFRVALMLHLVVAMALLVHVIALFTRSWKGARRESWLLRPATGLLGLTIFQVGLGGATWVAKWGWPSWLGDYSFAAGHVVMAEGPSQAWHATTHVATGSLILATSLMIAVRAARGACGTFGRPRMLLLMEAVA